MQKRPRVRTTLDYRINAKLQLGIEINAAVNEVGPRGNWFIQTETDTRPGIVAGFSSDRIGTPSGMSYFVSAQKQLGGAGGRVAPYVGLSYSQWGKEFLTPFGASIALRDDLTLIPMCDGKYGHTTLTWSDRRGGSVSLIAAFNKRFGLSLGKNF